MKRLIASIAVLLILTSYLLSCEKDDLCTDETPTTPGLVLEFYQNGNRDVVFPIDIAYYAGSNIVDPAGTQSSITLPLRADADSTELFLQYNRVSTGGVRTVNVDRFTVNYTRKQVYVSRACGYKTIYTLLPDSDTAPNPIVSDGPVTDGVWIRDFDILTTDITYDNEVHIKIYL